MLQSLFRFAASISGFVSILASVGTLAADGRSLERGLRAHVSFLASDALGGRDSDASVDVAAAYVAAQFRRVGLLPGAGAYYTQSAPGIRNVIGILPSSEMWPGGEFVLVTAHLDHVGIGSEAPDAPTDRIFNGANDNASGVAAMIEIAAALRNSAAELTRTVVFIAFSGEEDGLVGSRYYAANPAVPLNRTVAQLNLEQLGRTDDAEGIQVRKLSLTGFDYSEVPEILRAAAARVGVAVQKRDPWSEAAFERSDNEALAKRGVPAHTAAVSFEFADYHKAGDEWHKLDYENMALITRALTEGVRELATRPRAPRWLSVNPSAEQYSAMRP